jgi:hypothetical protein
MRLKRQRVWGHVERLQLYFNTVESDQLNVGATTVSYLDSS